ncbi:MAG: hypothetical protein AB1631_02615 [Acidobacteriota bacterium]
MLQDRSSRSDFSAHPERGASLDRGQERKCLSRFFIVFSPQVMIGKQDFELAVEHQKSHQEILLVPENLFLRDSMTRIIQGNENVVQMNYHARFESRQYLEKQRMRVFRQCQIERAEIFFYIGSGSYFPSSRNQPDCTTSG